MSQRYNIHTNERREISDSDYQAWSDKGFEKAAIWQPVPAQPAFDPATQKAPVWSGGQWVVTDKTPEEIAAEAAAATRKVWATGADFLNEFALPELAAVSLSTDPTVASLRLLLAAWASEVWSDDPRVQAGMAAVVASGILSAERAAAILAKPE